MIQRDTQPAPCLGEPGQDGHRHGPLGGGQPRGHLRAPRGHGGAGVVQTPLPGRGWAAPAQRRAPGGGAAGMGMEQEEEEDEGQEVGLEVKPIGGGRGGLVM